MGREARRWRAAVAAVLLAGAASGAAAELTLCETEACFIEHLSAPPQAGGFQTKGLSIGRAPPRVGALVHFDFDSTTVRPDSWGVLAELGRALASAALQGAVVEIRGHTDAVGREEYNQALSERRAAAVKAFLVEAQGTAPGRLVTSGGGEAEPVAGNDSEAGRALNRRVELVRVGTVGQ